MDYVQIDKADYSIFHDLLNDYYRDGEDADTPQEEIDYFIQYLFDLCAQNKISGCIAYQNVPVGFVLWNIDTEDGVFSNKPGYGTILEIGVKAKQRGKGIGKELVSYAQSRMSVSQYYVCAYGPAEHFWLSCGYCDSGELADNGLKMFTKG